MNPARWNPAEVTTIAGLGSSRVLAVPTPSGSRRAVVMTYGTVLQSNIVKETPTFSGSSQNVLQVVLAPFQHEWSRISQFYGTVFDKRTYSISIYGPMMKVEGVEQRVHGLQIRSRPSEKTDGSAEPMGTSSCYYSFFYCLIYSMF